MSMNHPRVSSIALAALLVLAGGCASRSQDRSGLLEPHRIDLPQGNYVTREMLAQVKPGLTREQVRVALGAPLLQSIFRADRWDYVFRYQRPNGQAELRRVMIRFADDRVLSVDADALPEREDGSDPAMPGYRAPAAKDAASPPAGGTANTTAAPVGAPKENPK